MPELDILAVDLGAVGALQIGEHDLVLIGLDLDVKATDALVVELDRVAFLAPMVTGVSRFSNTRPRSAPSNTQGDRSHKQTGHAAWRAGDTGTKGRTAAVRAPARPHSALIACGQKQGQAALKILRQFSRNLTSSGEPEGFAPARTATISALGASSLTIGCVRHMAVSGAIRWPAPCRPKKKPPAASAEGSVFGCRPAAQPWLRRRAAQTSPSRPSPPRMNVEGSGVETVTEN